MAPLPPPDDVQVIGRELALRWPDGREDYIPVEQLRAASPSAENVGERDILGNLYGGTAQKKFPGVEIEKWHVVGGYALRFEFSDGHSTGIYSYTYLRDLADALKVKRAQQEGGDLGSFDETGDGGDVDAEG